MQGAVFYASKYGSTAEYAGWIAEATGLPVFDVNRPDVSVKEAGFAVIVTPVLYYKLYIAKWLHRNLAALEGKPVILVTVSGAPAGEKLDAWIGGSLPAAFVARAEHFALRGRQVPEDLTWFDRAMLIIAAWRNPDPQARREELMGFDYMDRDAIAPIVARIEALKQS